MLTVANPIGNALLPSQRGCWERGMSLGTPFIIPLRTSPTEVTEIHLMGQKARLDYLCGHISCLADYKLNESHDLI